MSQKEDEAFARWMEELKGSFKDKPKALEALELLVSDSPDGAREVFRGYVGGKEVSRRLQEAADLRKKVETEAADFVSQRNSWWAWYQEAQPRYQAMEARVKELEAAGGGAGGEELDEMGKKELEKLQAQLAEVAQRVAQVDAGAVNYATMVAQVAMRAQRDKVDIDLEKVTERAAREGSTLMDAYAKETAEEFQKRQAAEAEAREKEAYERGKREAAAGLKTPDGIGTGALIAPLEIPFNGPLSNTDERRKRALATFMETAH